MSGYKSAPKTINAPVQAVYDKLTNLGEFQKYVEMLPAEELAKIGDVRFTDEAIVISAPAVGEMVLRVVEKKPASLIKFNAEGAPVRLEIIVNLTPASETTTSLVAELDVEIPAMLRPMIGSKLQEVADKMGDMLAKPFNISK